MAQKAFSNYDFYPLLSEYLSGTEASGLYEARLGAEKMPGKQDHIYRLAGPTCLSGDVIGDYGFSYSLAEGDLLLFGDMAIYSTCKNNTFNGMPLPNIWRLTESGQLLQLTDFGYDDFQSRLGSRTKQSSQ